MEFSKRLSIPLALLLVAPMFPQTAASTPSWDFVIRYEILESTGAVTYTKTGEVPYGMGCPGGWSISEVVTLVVPGAIRLQTVYVSYSGGVVKFETEANAQRSTTTYSCSNPTPLSETPVSSSSGQHVTDTGASVLAPLDHQDTRFYRAHPCARVVFEPAGDEGVEMIPFTGTLGIRLLKGHAIWGYYSSTWIAGTRWQLTGEDTQGPDSGFQCALHMPGGSWQVDWDTGSTSRADLSVGNWRGTLYGCGTGVC